VQIFKKKLKYLKWWTAR